MYTMNQSVWEKWERVGKIRVWQEPHYMAWRAGLWPAGRLLHTPVLLGLKNVGFTNKNNNEIAILVLFQAC